MKTFIKLFLFICCTITYPMQNILAHNLDVPTIPYAYYSNVTAKADFEISGSTYEFEGTFRINVNENSGYINSISLSSFTTNYKLGNKTASATIISSSDYSTFVKKVFIQISIYNNGTLYAQDAFYVYVTSSGPRKL